METNRETALVKQIADYNLGGRLKDLAEKEALRRPFRHLPKQFSKGILIGNIAIVPRKVDDTRFVYVIADMVSAKIIYDSINLKQTAILVAHYLADDRHVPQLILNIDQHFASREVQRKVWYPTLTVERLVRPAPLKAIKHRGPASLCPATHEHTVIHRRDALPLAHAASPNSSNQPPSGRIEAKYTVKL